jgi:hypothetical protein
MKSEASPQGMEVSEQREEKMKREKRKKETKKNPRRRGVFVTN